ncbi:hypothetical protein NKG05_22930 [Oerskovia sp. M15]
MEAWIVENELVLTFVVNSLIAVGTLAAVVWAVWSSQREVKRGETYRREHLDQEERHQAERVTAWVREAPEVLILADDDELDGDQNDGLRVLRVINTSDAPSTTSRCGPWPVPCRPCTSGGTSRCSSPPTGRSRSRSRRRAS